jgi:hypothetical protein
LQHRCRMVAPGGRRGEQYRHKAQARFRRLMAALAALVGGRDEKWFRNCAQKTRPWSLFQTNDMYLAINSLPSRSNSCAAREVDAAGSLATTSSIYCPTAVESF